MRRRLHSGPLLGERFLRGMALFFLFFTFADIAFPPPCSEATECAAASSTASAPRKNYDKTVNALALVANDDLCPSRSPDQQCGDEDCCFGCAHMLSISVITGAVVFDLRSQGAIPSALFVPAPPIRLTDHPPRFA